MNFCTVEGTYLRMTWAKKIVQGLYDRCEKEKIRVGEEISTLILTVPYVFIT